jgi:uncharacterized protein
MSTVVPAGPILDGHARLVKRPGSVGRLLATMDSCGIERAAVSAGGLIGLDRLSAQLTDGGYDTVSADNDWIRRCCMGAGGRLIPFYFANPHGEGDDYRQRAADFRGLEISPAVHGVGLDDPRVVDLVEVAATARHPVYLVCLGRPGAQPRDLVALARAFPDVTFMFGHCGLIGIDADGIGRIAGQGNIVAETSGCLTTIVRLALDRLGADRVVFGTEYPLQHPRVELAKYAALDLGTEAWHRVAWRTAHRILGEPVD